ncbi:MAG: hypothetical protein Q9209_001397 [Squamulea sp. 1 TL-2023]
MLIGNPVKARYQTYFDFRPICTPKQFFSDSEPTAAVEGLTESISHELKPEWNIKVQCVEPGGFRTDWSGRSMVFPERRHPAYDHIDAKKDAEGRHMKQAGDPIKGAKAMYDLAVMKDPPLRVVVGSDAYKAIMGKIEAYSENYKKYQKISNSTDVD